MADDVDDPEVIKYTRSHTVHELYSECESAYQACLGVEQLQPFSVVEDELARFRVWGSNIGATKPASSLASLDHRVRLSIRTKHLILVLLRLLKIQILYAIRTLQEPAEVLDQRPLSEDLSFPSLNINISWHQVSPSIKGKEVIPQLTTQGKALVLSLKALQAGHDQVTKLQRLSLAIRQASHRHYDKKLVWERDVAEGLDQEAQDNEECFRLLIRYRFPIIEDWLLNTMVTAMSFRSRRFRYNELRYRKRIQAQKLTTTTKMLAQVTHPAPTIPTESIESIVISQNPPKPSSDPPSSLLLSTASTLESKLFQLPPSVSPSLASSASAPSAIGKTYLPWPERPKTQGVTAFVQPQCPYCLDLLDADESRSNRYWRKHLKKDLEPYNCFHPGCQERLSMFTTEQQWYTHVHTKHSQGHRWICPIQSHGKQQYFETAALLEIHLLQEHDGSFPQSQLQLLIRTSQRTRNIPAFESCPFGCEQEEHAPEKSQKHQPDGNALSNHIANHLLTLALECFPTISQGDDSVEETDAIESLTGSPNLNNTPTSRHLSDTLSFDSSGLMQIPEDSLVDVHFEYHGMRVPDIVPATHEGAGPNFQSDYDPEHDPIIKHLRSTKTIESIIGPLDRSQLPEYNSELVLQHVAAQRCPGTTWWILDHPEFRLWRTAPQSACLWLDGPIGCGKTVLASTIVEALLHVKNSSKPPILHFFFDHSRPGGLTAMSAITSFIQQIGDYLLFCGKGTSTSVSVDSALHGKNTPGAGMELAAIQDHFFHLLLDGLLGVFIIVDGLDQCSSAERTRLLHIVVRLLGTTQAKVLITGKPSILVEAASFRANLIRIRSADVADDIGVFIKYRIEEKMRERSITTSPNESTKIMETLYKSAEGMFLYVKLQIEAVWNQKSFGKDVETTLKGLPASLGVIYERELRRVINRENTHHYAKRVIPYMLASPRPFTQNEIQQALSANPLTGILQAGSVLPYLGILRSCGDLVLHDSRNLQFSHQSIRQYLLEFDNPLNTNNRLSGRTEFSNLASLCVRHLMTSNNNSSGQLLEFSQYAKEYWPQLTRDIRPTDPHYAVFRSLCVAFKSEQRVHPWVSSDQSVTGHLVGLLGWSIVHDHKPMFDLLFDAKVNTPWPTILETPNDEYDGLNSLFLAIKFNAVEIFATICRLKGDVARAILRTSRDTMEQTSLHWVAKTGNAQIATILCDTLKVMLDSMDKRGRFALTVAAEGGHHEVVERVLNITDPGSPFKFEQAIEAAERNGHNDIAQYLYSFRRTTR